MSEALSTGMSNIQFLIVSVNEMKMSLPPKHPWEILISSAVWDPLF